MCERIPTIGTQLKILSTVKATMLGAQGTLGLSPLPSCVRMSQHSDALISRYLNWSVTLIVLVIVMIINIYNVDSNVFLLTARKPTFLKDVKYAVLQS